MWKRLDPQIATSEKHVKLGFSSLTLWVMMLPHTDSKGRYWANAAFIKGQCLPLFDHVRLEQVEAALLDLQKVGLIHLFDTDGKRYLVFHDVEDFNPPGALRYNRPQWPAPPDDICKCIAGRVSGALALLVPVSSSSPSPEEAPLASSPAGLLLEAMRAEKIRGGRDQLRNSAEGWIAQKGFPFSQELVMSGKVRGWDVLDISKAHFSNARPKGSEAVFTPAKTKCANCGGSGKVAGAVVGGAIQMVPCGRCGNERRKA